MRRLAGHLEAIYAHQASSSVRPSSLCHVSVAHCGLSDDSDFVGGLTVQRHYS